MLTMILQYSVRFARHTEDCNAFQTVARHYSGYVVSGIYSMQT